MPLSKLLYPYETTSQLGIRLASEPYDPDNENLTFSLIARDEASDEEVQTLDLSGHQHPWQSLKIDLEARVPEAELRRVLPAPSDPRTDAALLVVVTCSETRVRRPAILTLENGVWKGSVTLRRDDVRGTVRLYPRLVRVTSFPLENDEAVSVAADPSFVLGDGRSFDIRVDPPPPLEGVLQIRWENFAESTDEWRKRHSSDLFALDQDEARPTLFLNSFFAEFKAALHSGSKTGGAAVIRHLANALIAQTVWMQLFASVLSSIEKDDDTGLLDLPPAGWRRDVLRALLARAYPGLEPAEQLSRLHALQDDSQDAVLMTVLASAAQSAARSSQAVKRAVGAANIISQRSED